MMLEQRLEEALRALGTAQIGHSERSFFAHLTGTYHLLKNWENSDEVCYAGLFHSIYGTEFFRVEVVPLDGRDKIKALIGERAERLAYYFCATERRALLGQNNRWPPHIMRDRLAQKEYEITSADYRDLAEIAIANFIEQAPNRSALSESRLPFYIEHYSVCLGRCSAGAVSAYRSYFGL
jgi:hypothetical protein